MCKEVERQKSWSRGAGRETYGREEAGELGWDPNTQSLWVSVRTWDCIPRALGAIEGFEAGDNWVDLRAAVCLQRPRVFLWVEGWGPWSTVPGSLPYFQATVPCTLGWRDGGSSGGWRSKAGGRVFS